MSTTEQTKVLIDESPPDSGSIVIGKWNYFPGVDSEIKGYKLMPEICNKL